jgi:hypothetical protein
MTKKAAAKKPVAAKQPKAKPAKVEAKVDHAAEIKETLSAPTPVGEKPKAAKKAAKAKAEPKPRHNEKVMGYVAAVRAQHGAKVANMTDDDVAAKVWRFASVEKALAVFA